jgi:hypothetical protein
MTICVAVKVNDCVVFAADSATSITDDSGNILNVFDHGNKVFNLYKGLQIAAMTCGMGNIGSQSISTIAKDLRLRLKKGGPDWQIDVENYQISDIAEKARKFIFEDLFEQLPFKPASPHNLTFYIGGYSSKSEAHELWEVKIENGQSPAAFRVSHGECGLHWAGQPEPISRLVFGLSQEIQNMLVKEGLDEVKVTAAVDKLRPSLQAQLVFDAMPVKDAIDLARFLVETTKSYYKFLPGADIVGGDTDIAVVTRHEGFKWISRKHYYPASLNLMETDHA